MTMKWRKNGAPTIKERLEAFGMMFLGRRFMCKFVYKKHEYEYRSTYWEGQKPYRWKVHIRACKHCGSTKRVSV